MTKEEFRQYRDSMGITQKELALRLGVTTQAVYLWEAGERKVPLAISKLVRIMSVACGQPPAV